MNLSDRELTMTHTDNAKTYCLVVSCPDTVGIVAAVSKFVAENNGSFIESNHYTDIEGEWFYFRNVINAPSLSISLQEFRQKFAAIAEKFDMQWNIRANNEKQKVVLFASHASHCLADLLHRWHSSELSCDIPCVISNHENLRSMVDWHGIPFHYIPVTKENKPEAFKQMNEVVNRYNADAIVLARYMQIIPPEICKDYAGRLINIHHSFLPSFIG
ncbi:MAG: formyltetrahydrofolate deformylase, partial [Pseudohongiellaceae bacterium]